MHKRTKLLFMVFIAVFACSLPAGSATANRSIRVSGGPTVRSWARLRILGTSEAGSQEITCALTLLRTIGSVIPKTPGTQFGRITGMAIDRGETARSPHCGHGSFIREVHDFVPLNCTHTENGRGILLWDCSRAPAGLWKLIYDSFQGTLPEISGINFHVSGLQFNQRLLEPFGGTIGCLYEGNGFGLFSVSRRIISQWSPVTSITGLTRTSGSGICPARATWEWQGPFPFSIELLEITLQ
jgi:hypothetical protein